MNPLRITGPRLIALLVLPIVVMAGCGKAARPLVVGSMNSTEQNILSEIVAQHLEHRLGRKIDRQPDLGGSLNAYQALQSGEVGMYPEYTGAIITEILKEQAATDPAAVFERARSEMKRVAQAQLFDSLGFDNGFVAVIRSDDPRAAKVSTLSEAAAVSDGWKLAASYEFQQLSDGLPTLVEYKLPMRAAPRSMEGNLLFKALEQMSASMIIARATDGILTQKDWKVLSDDRHLFAPRQACLLVKMDLVSTQPGLGPALSELSGKITAQKMRAMNAMVDLGQVAARDVAASFLGASGLK
jgi:osmoprotectant transport system substrate-binding protein